MTTEQYAEYFAKLEEELARQFIDALIVEFRPKLWNQQLTKAYMQVYNPVIFREPDDEYVAFQYFAANFKSAVTIKEQQ